MSDRLYRGRPEAKIGEPAVLTGQRVNPYTGKIITKSIKVECWKGEQSFEIDGWTYQVTSTEPNRWDDIDGSAPLWTMSLVDNKK